MLFSYLTSFSAPLLFLFPILTCAYSEGLYDTFKSHPARGTWTCIQFPSCVASCKTAHNKNINSVLLAAIPCLISQSPELLFFFYRGSQSVKFMEEFLNGTHSPARPRHGDKCEVSVCQGGRYKVELNQFR